MIDILPIQRVSSNDFVELTDIYKQTGIAMKTIQTMYRFSTAILTKLTSSHHTEFNFSFELSNEGIDWFYIEMDPPSTYLNGWISDEWAEAYQATFHLPQCRIFPTLNPQAKAGLPQTTWKLYYEIVTPFLASEEEVQKCRQFIRKYGRLAPTVITSYKEKRFQMRLNDLKKKEGTLVVETALALGRFVIDQLNPGYNQKKLAAEYMVDRWLQEEQKTISSLTKLDFRPHSIDTLRFVINRQKFMIDLTKELLF